MSLHPGERGVCPLHGEYDEYCEPCAVIKRVQKNTRIADQKLGIYQIQEKLVEYQLTPDQINVIVGMIRGML